MLKKTPRSEVVSLRLNQDRLELLERYRVALAAELGRDVSLSEAAFLGLEDRAVAMDRKAARVELLRTPTESLARIRKRWESRHALSAVEWDVLAQYVHIGADEERQQVPRVPSRESYLSLLNAFEAVYTHRAEPASRHTWTYFSNLKGILATDTASVTDPEQRHQTVVMQIARRQAVLESTNDWDTPGNVGHCFWTAVLEEDVDSTILDQLLAPYWPVLWRLAARGHWIRHAHRPTRSGEIRRSGPLIPPRPLSEGELTLSCRSAPGGDLIVTIASRSRGFGLEIARYPELMEFRVLVETTEDRWVGRYYAMTVEVQPPGVRRVQLRRRRIYLEFSKPEWIAVRDLMRRAWHIPYVQYCLAELQQEYGEHG